MILKGDCLDKLKELDENSIDCLVTDPPYGISFMGKSWDNFEKGQKDLIEAKDNGYKSGDASTNMKHNHPQYKFEGMNQFFTPIFKEALRVMKPGAFGFVCCIPRQDCLSRMMISLEDAGFKINFSSLYWTYATGFPKAMNIGKKIDKKLKKERKIIGEKERPSFIGPGKNCYDQKTHKEDKYITGPASDLAKKMEGSYGGFQPKPAVEVIIVVMKPLSEAGYLKQAMTDGKGVTWLDDCRVPYASEENIDFNKDFKYCDILQSYDPNISEKEKEIKGIGKEYKPSGRFPANLLISDDILGEHSKFYDLDVWAQRNLPFIICPKAPKKEKNAGIENNNHPTVKPMKLMSYLITLGSRKGDVILDPFAGSFTTYCAAIMLNRKCVGIEKEDEYIEIGKARVKYYQDLFNKQPLKV